MDNTHSWIERFEQELEQAQQARAAGNEGMARVCARRAAGIVIEEYLRRKGMPKKDSSAYDRLRYLASLPDIPPGTHNIVDHLLLRVDPDHNLPIDVDLITETHRLKEILLNA